MDDRSGLHRRGYLPHLELEGATQYVTFRLNDALPIEVLAHWNRELSCLSERDRDKEFYRRCERFLDEGCGSCLLRNPVAARIVQETLVQYSRSHYDLHDWVVMPNHVHAMLTP